MFFKAGDCLATDLLLEVFWFMAKVLGRCMKCKTEREMKDVKEVTMKNGMKAAKGKCSVCGTTMFKIIGKA